MYLQKHESLMFHVQLYCFEEKIKLLYESGFDFKIKVDTEEYYFLLFNILVQHT